MIKGFSFASMGIMEILFVAVIVFLVFGPVRITGVFKAFKDGIDEFKKNLKSREKKSKTDEKKEDN